MASVTDWLYMLAEIRALYDLAKFGSDYSASVLKYRSEIEIYREAQRVSKIYHTSQPEMRALHDDIEACRCRLTNQDSGEDRGMCLCRLFNRIKEGNGGNLPPVDCWEQMYVDLGCGSSGSSGPHVAPFA
jgi:hypothetical protein